MPEEQDFRPITVSQQVAGWAPGYCAIHDVKILDKNGDITNQIKVGEEFHVQVTYTATNEEGHLLDPWMTLVTVKGGGILNYEDTEAYGTSLENHVVNLGNLGNNIMPPGDTPLVLFIKLWINDLISDPLPSQELW